MLRLFSKPVATGSLATVTCPHSCCRLPCSSHQRLRHHHPHSARQQPGSATTLALLTWLSGSAATSSASELDRACSSGDDASVEVRRSLRRRNHGGMLHRIVREKRRGESIFDISPTFSPKNIILIGKVCSSKFVVSISRISILQCALANVTETSRSRFCLHLFAIFWFSCLTKLP